MELRHIKSAINAAIGAVAALILPMMTAVWVLLSGEPPDIIDGKADDAPVRSIGLLLALTPFFVAILGGYFFCVTSALREFGKLSLWNLLGAGILCSAAVGWFFLFQGLQVGGIWDGITAFGIFFGGSFASLTIGSVAWWLFRVRN